MGDLSAMAKVAFHAFYGPDADWQAETGVAKQQWVRVAMMVTAWADKFRPDGGEKYPSQLDRVEEAANKILKEIQTMGTSQAQLDTEIAALGAQVTALTTAVTTAINDLVAKAASNPSAPVADFTAELNSLQQIGSQLTALQSTATADDPGAPAAASSSTPATS